MKSKFAIFDLDGTLADDRWRFPHNVRFTPAEYWDAYHSGSICDVAINLELLPEEDTHLVVLTGRPEVYREQTVMWLDANLNRPYDLIMRPDSKLSTPTIIYKLTKMQGILSSARTAGQELLFVADNDLEFLLALNSDFGILAEQLVYCYWNSSRPAYRHIDEIITKEKLESWAEAGRSPPEVWLGRPPKTGVAEILTQAASTFAERDASYGAGYKRWGALMQAIFPEGLSITKGDVAAYNRLGVLGMCVTKLVRYANALPSGGHKDSAHDLCVYAAMLEELTTHSGGSEESDDLPPF
jgi:hypothetical protein